MKVSLLHMTSNTMMDVLPNLNAFLPSVVWQKDTSKRHEFFARQVTENQSQMVFEVLSNRTRRGLFAESVESLGMQRNFSPSWTRHTL